MKLQYTHQQNLLIGGVMTNQQFENTLINNVKESTKVNKENVNMVYCLCGELKAKEESQ